MKKHNKLLAWIAATLAITGTAIADNALRLMPTRVVMMNEHTSELTLINTGTLDGTYRIFLQNMRTDDNGVFSKAEAPMPGELFADKFIRYSPKAPQVSPGNFQKVRIMARRPKGLEDGEYRTHMVFQTLPKQGSNVLLGEGEDLDVSVQQIVEVSIPIILRQGKLSAQAEIESVRTEEDKITIKLNREGNRSIYGELEIFTNDSEGNEVRIGHLKGIAVYVPNETRNVSLPYTLPEGVDIDKAELTVRFTEDPTYGGDQVAEYTTAQ